MEKSIRREDWKDLKPTVYGWGINDVNYTLQYFSKSSYLKGYRTSKQISCCPYYKVWKEVVSRCFNSNLHSKYPTYRGCSISEDWKYLSNFIKWVDSQPNKDWQNCELDKDLLVEGNKYYSPQTTVFIPTALNLFLPYSPKSRGNLMLGVFLKKGKKLRPYCAQCSNPFKAGERFVGYYDTELEAHLAWQTKKHEHALKLADMQDDPRVADALRQRYAPDKDWTNR